MKHLSDNTSAKFYPVGNDQVRDLLIPSTGLSALIGKFGRNLAEYRKRLEIHSLLQMDDAVLKDLNISRDDIRHVLKLPLTVNAGRKLEMLRSKNAG